MKHKEKNEKTKPQSERYARMKVNAELLKDAKQNAHSIVLALLDSGVSEKFFAEKIPFITPENFEDVVIERAITGICGYPLCASEIDQTKFGSQTYIIRCNKVYDITQRRNFCSDRCYEASELILRQIPTVPLYLRSSDRETQKLKLFIPELSSLNGRKGKLVHITGTILDSDIDIMKTKKKPNTKKNKQSSAESVSSNLSVSMNDSTSSVLNESSSGLVTEGDVTRSSKSLDSSSQFGLSPSHEYVGDTTRISSSSCSADAESSSSEDTHTPEVEETEETVSRTNVCKENKATTDVQDNRRVSDLRDIHEQIESTLRDWMTFESLRMILGDVYVRGMLEHLGKTWEDYDTTAGLRLGVESKARYISLCKRLDSEEVKERMMDAQMSSVVEGEEEGAASDLQPMPDYEQLKRDVEQSSLKVRAFYEGAEEFVECKEKLETIQEEDEHANNTRKGKRKGKETKKKVKEEDIDLMTLPLIDNYAQNTWRRQIVLEKLSKALSNYAYDLELDEGELRRLIVPLIATFDFKATNITFKMRQWNFVALILIKMLSVRYPAISQVLNSSVKSYNIVIRYLTRENLDANYLDRLLAYLTEISYILTKYHKEPTPYPVNNELTNDNDVATNNNNVFDSEMKHALIERDVVQSFANMNIEEKISTNEEELD